MDLGFKPLVFPSLERRRCGATYYSDVTAAVDGVYVGVLHLAGCMPAFHALLEEGLAPLLGLYFLNMLSFLLAAAMTSIFITEPQTNVGYLGMFCTERSEGGLVEEDVAAVMEEQGLLGMQATRWRINDGNARDEASGCPRPLKALCRVGKRDEQGAADD